MCVLVEFISAHLYCIQSKYERQVGLSRFGPREIALLFACNRAEKGNHASCFQFNPRDFSSCWVHWRPKSVNQLTSRLSVEHSDSQASSSLALEVHPNNHRILSDIWTGSRKTRSQTAKRQTRDRQRDRETHIHPAADAEKSKDTGTYSPMSIKT